MCGSVLSALPTLCLTCLFVATCVSIELFAPDFLQGLAIHSAVLQRRQWLLGDTDADTCASLLAVGTLAALQDQRDIAEPALRKAHSGYCSGLYGNCYYFA